MKVKILVRVKNNLDRTHVYQSADSIDTGRKKMMTKCKANPYKWYEFYTMKGTYLGCMQYRSERKDFVWSSKNVKSSRIATNVKKDGSLGSKVELW